MDPRRGDRFSARVGRAESRAGLASRPPRREAPLPDEGMAFPEAGAVSAGTAWVGIAEADGGGAIDGLAALVSPSTSSKRRSSRVFRAGGGEPPAVDV
jgi:hypothetical protein